MINNLCTCVWKTALQLIDAMGWSISDTQQPTYHYRLMQSA
ncbi:MAG: hypothetical protein RLZZ54_2185 [Cyanobacteriota bacterium]|jgi:hypothetical protein